MSGVANQEVTIAAAVRTPEATKANLALAEASGTGATESARAVAETRERMAKNKGGSTVENVQQYLAESRKGINSQLQDEVLDSNFGVMIDATSGKKDYSTDHAAETRLRHAKHDAELVRDLITKGYDHLDDKGKKPATKTTRRDEAIKLVEELFHGNPDLLATLPKDKATRDALIADILRNPNAVKEVTTLYKSTMTEESKLEDTVTPARLAYEKLNAELVAKTTERDAAATALQKAKDMRISFEPGGSNVIELENLTNQLPGLRNELTENNDAIAVFGRSMKNLQGQLLQAQVDGDAAEEAKIEAALDIIKAKRLEKTTRNSEIEKLQARQRELKEAKDNAPKDEEKFTRERDLLETARTDLERRTLIAKGSFEGLKISRARDEQEFADEVSSMLQGGVAEFIHAEIGAADKARTELLNEEIAKTADLAARILQKEAEVRYRKGYNKGGNPLGRYEKSGDLDTDMVMLTEEDPSNPTKGADRIVSRMLTYGLKREVAAGRMTQAEADKMYDERMADKDWVTKMRPTATEALVAARINTGGLSEKEAMIIVKSDWGKDLIDRALQVNPKAEAALQAVKDMGVLQGATREQLIEDLKKKAPGLILSVLLALLGGGGAVFVGQRIIH